MKIALEIFTFILKIFFTQKFANYNIYLLNYNKNGPILQLNIYHFS